GKPTNPELSSVHGVLFSASGTFLGPLRSSPVKIEDCKLDLAGHTFVDCSGREVRLTRAEAALLTAFVDSPRRVLSRDQLRYAVAGRGAKPYDRSVNMLVARLQDRAGPEGATIHPLRASALS